MFEQYNHHGFMNWVRSDLKGTHREHCLCFRCKELRIGSDSNCPRAKRLYAFCCETGMVTPVFECDKFQEGEPTFPEE